MEIYYKSDIELNYIGYVFLIFYILVLLFSYKQLKTYYAMYFSDLLKLKFHWLVIIIMSCLCINMMTLHNKNGYANIINDNRLNVVEGSISEYNSNLVASRGESFFVNSVFFEYNDYGTPSYFFANRKYGDKIIKNGRYLKVFYIKDGGNNHIVKIQVNREHPCSNQCSNQRGQSLTYPHK